MTRGRFRDARHASAPRLERKLSRFERKIANSARMLSCYFGPQQSSKEGERYELAQCPWLLPHCGIIGQLQWFDTGLFQVRARERQFDRERQRIGGL